MCFSWQEATEELSHESHMGDAKKFCFKYNGHYLSIIDGHITFVKNFSPKQLVLLFSDYLWTECAEALYQPPPDSPTFSYHSSLSNITVSSWDKDGTPPASIHSDTSSEELFDLIKLDEECEEYN